jgi:putative redox protein
MFRDHKVKWSGGLTFTGTGASGHSVVLDSDKAIGLSPMELLLLGAGGCACIDLVMILGKARQKVVDAWVEIGGERRQEMPRYYTDIEMHFVIKGMDISERHVSRAIDLAMEKYCSASAQLAALADIKTSYEIIEAEIPSDRVP